MFYQIVALKFQRYDEHTIKEKGNLHLGKWHCIQAKSERTPRTGRRHQRQKLRDARWARRTWRLGRRHGGEEEEEWPWTKENLCPLRSDCRIPSFLLPSSNIKKKRNPKKGDAQKRLRLWIVCLAFLHSRNAPRSIGSNVLQPSQGEVAIFEKCLAKTHGN